MTNQEVEDIIDKRETDIVSCRLYSNSNNLYNLIYYGDKLDRSYTWIINKALENYFINKKAPSQR